MAAVRKNPVTFETSDGREFDTEDAAKRHQEVIDKLKAFENAKQLLCFAICKEYKTADGHPFDFLKHSYYYFVRIVWGTPQLERVEIPGRYWANLADVPQSIKERLRAAFVYGFACGGEFEAKRSEES